METLAVPEQQSVAPSFREAMRRMSSTVTIVTAAEGRRRHGMTMTAFSALSMDPPALLVCVNRSTLLHDIMVGARHFCVNVLRHDQAEVSSAFSGGVPPEQRFGIGSWSTHALGIDYLDAAQANIFCRKSAAMPYGTHVIFIGTVEEVVLHEDDARPLLYRNAAYC